MIFKKQEKNKKSKTLKSILIGIGLLFVVLTNIFAPIQKAQAQYDAYNTLFSGSKIRAINTTDTTSDIQITIKTDTVDNYDKVAGDGGDPQAFVFIARNQKTNYTYQAVINVNTSATVNNINTGLTGLKKGENYSVGVFYRSDEDGEGGGIDVAGISTNKDYYLVAQSNFIATGDSQGGGYNPSTIESGDNSDNAPKAKNEGVTKLPICSTDILSFNVPGCIAQGIYYLFFVPTSFIFSLSGQLLDWTMDYSLDSNSYNSTSFVAEGWKIMRDLSNMLFIFILLYTAIGTILGLGGVNAKETIIKIVIVALFINFSLFFSQIVIDASNIVGRIFYESMGVKKGNSLTYNAFQDENTKSISVAIVSQFNPQNLFQESEKLNLNTPGGVIEDQNATTGTPAGQFAIISLIMSAINLVGAYIFFVVAFLFIGRVVGLWLAMIMAPLAFISFTLPGGFSLKGFGLQEWWSKLVSLAFVVPVFLFFMYLIIKFLRVIDLNQIIGTNSFTTTQVIMATCIPLVFIVILLTKAKSVAIDMSGEVAKYAMQGASFVGGLAVGAATGGMGTLGRATLGRAANSIANDESLKEEASKSGIGGMWARTKLDAARNMSSSSFDARNAKIAGKDIASATGFSVGKGQTGGFAADRKAQVEKELKFNESLKVGEDSKLTQEKYKADLAKAEAEKANKKDKEILDAVLNNKDSTEDEREEAKRIYNEKQSTKNKIAAEKRASEAQTNIDKANKVRANNYAEKIEKGNFVELETLKQGAISAIKGAAAGAVAGSVIPGVGTLIGGAIGATAGAVKGVVDKSNYSEKGGQEAANKIRAGIKPPKAPKKDANGNPIAEVDTSGIIEAISKINQNQPQAGGPNQNQGGQNQGTQQNTPQQNQQQGTPIIKPTGLIPKGNQNNNSTPPTTGTP